MEHNRVLIVSDSPDRRNFLEIHMGRSSILKDHGNASLRIHAPGKRITWEDGRAVDGGRIAGTYLG